MSSDELMPVPVPALCVMLLNLEKEKGASLSYEEVIEARDNAGCIMMPRSVKETLDERRGYLDIDPENVWESWLSFRAWYASQQS